jgi:hypothetical protein
MEVFVEQGLGLVKPSADDGTNYKKIGSDETRSSWGVWGCIMWNTHAHLISSLLNQPVPQCGEAS